MKKSTVYKSKPLGNSLVIAATLLLFIPYVVGLSTKNIPVVFISALITLVLFCVYYARNSSNHIIILLFNLNIFIFMFGRYLVRSINNIPMDAAPKYTLAALNIVYISLFTSNVVYILAKKKQSSEKINLAKQSNNRLKLFTSIGLTLSALCAMAVSITTYRYLARFGYESLYLDPSIPLPAIVVLIGHMFPFFVALVLARMPNKSTAHTLLFIYFILQVPLLIAGRRMPALTALLVWTSYIMLRHHQTNEKYRWLGHKEKIAIAVMVPVIIIMIPIIGDRRGGSSGSNKIGTPIERTLDSQGITLDVVSRGLEFKNQTPRSIYKYYTIAPLMDYAATNFISRTIFNTAEIPPQTEESAKLGKSYPDTISYLAMSKNVYYAGQGLGSSYMIETFIDFGIIGLMLYSTLLALLFRWMTDNFGASYIKTFIIMLLLMNIYALPRNMSTGFIVAILQIQVLCVISIAFVYNRFVNDFRKEKYGR